MEGGILCRRHLLDFQEGIQHAENQDGRAHIEGGDHRRGDDAFRRFIRDTDPGEGNRQEVTHKAAPVAEETLDGVSLGLLLLADHVADHHLEGLHRDIDAGIEEDQRKQAEPHRHVQAQEDPGREMEASGIGQQDHHQHGNQGADNQVGLAPAHPAPGAVAPGADQRLDDQAHQRRQDPEETQLVGIRAEGGENPGNIGALKSVSNLHAEESETQIPHLPEGKCAFAHCAF